MGKTTFSKGLAGVIAGESKIASVGLHHDDILYRGYSIKDLCDHCCYEEVAYLLLHGHLPTGMELKSFKKEIASMRDLPKELKVVLEQLPKDAHPMDVLRTGCSALGTMIQEEDRTKDQVQIATRLIASFGSMLMYWHHFATKGIRVCTLTSPSDSIAVHFLKLMHNDPNVQLHPLVIKTFDVSLILYAEHDFNASTFAAKVTSATMSDIYSAITSAIGTLRGPLHGGATEATMHMLAQFLSSEDATHKLEKKFATKELVMGFGHRLYKLGDPRSPIIQSWSKKLSEQKWGNKKLYEISEHVEQLMATKKMMYPNLDFYMASAYHQCGIPTKFFAPIFAIARTAGWAAHIFEQRADNMLIRPQSMYSGPGLQRFKPLDERNTISKL